MNHTSVRRLFIAVMIVLPIQYALVGLLGMTHGEPWPTVVLPGFQSVWDGEEELRIPRASFLVAFADGSRGHLDAADVLAPFPASHHLGILRMQFTPSGVSGSPRTERARNAETRRWLKQRVSTLFPDKDVHRVDVVWSEVGYAPRSGMLVEAALDTLRLHLD